MMPSSDRPGAFFQQGCLLDQTEIGARCAEMKKTTCMLPLIPVPIAVLVGGAGPNPIPAPPRGAKPPALRRPLCAVAGHGVCGLLAPL